MPFYSSPDEDDVVIFEDVDVGLGRISANGTTKRFVSVMHGGHVLGLDVTELGPLLRSLREAYVELIALCEQDEQKKAPSGAGETEPQTTQISKVDSRLN